MVALRNTVEMTDKAALISGAGIAGSTLAYWLARIGWQVTMVEKAAGVRSSGNPVDVRGDAAMIARAMGIWLSLEASATQVERLMLVDARGRKRASFSTRRSGSINDEVEIPRADLAAALLEAASAHAEIFFNDSITALREDADGVEVEFETVPRRRFDLVFGADGLHSTVRRLSFGPESNYSHPFGMFVGTVRTSIDTGDPHLVTMLNRPGLSLSIHPAGGNPLAAFIFRGRQSYDYRDLAAGKRLVEQEYAGAGWVTEQVLAEWRASDDIYFDTVTRIVMPSWTRGHISLIGDAASCVSLLGEGSSNAIVAAKTLADALASWPSNYGAALATYEKIHRNHIRGFQRGAGIASRFLVPATDVGISARNTAIRAISRIR